MSWRDRLFGTARVAPPRATTDPEPISGWENLARSRRRAGKGVGDLVAALRGRPASPVVVCPYGHLVPEGSTTCSYGHYVG